MTSDCDVDLHSMKSDLSATESESSQGMASLSILRAEFVLLNARCEANHV